MPHFNNYVFDQILFPSVIMFFFVWGTVAAIVGVGLIVNCAAVFRVFGSMNRSFSTRKATKSISVPIDSGTFVSKYRGWLGAFFIVGALYAVYGLVMNVDNAAVVSLLNLKLPRDFVLWIVQSTRLFLIVSCLVSILVGILLGFFPDTLQAIEKRSSRWYSTRRMVPQADQMNLTLDRWVAASPRVTGLMIVFPSLALVAYFGSLLLGRG